MPELSPEEREALRAQSATPNRWFCEYLTELFVELDYVPSFPVKVLWEVESRCHLDCEHCWADTTDEIDGPSLETKLETADEIAEEGAEVVSFSGGEPLLAPDLEPVVERLKDGDVRVELLTNGELVPKNIDWLANNLDDTDEVQVSIDGPPAVHERQRPGSSFERLRRGVGLLREEGISVRANFTATPINVETLSEVIGICAEEGVEPLSVLPVYPMGDGIELWERFSAETFLETVAAAAVDCPIELDIYLPIEAFELLNCLKIEEPTPAADGGELRVPLPEARTHVQIQADGGIYPGSELTDPAYRNGSIADRTLKAAWEDDTWDNLREGRRLTESKCVDCPYRSRCGGGNTARVLQFYGDIHHADPFCDYVPESESI
ncbi:radical SAM/SPASM domain-containing protein [Halorussus salinus]|uniref:radical SAM/SPASM domain-containing protein n=1 Tax=Halorussus salinus TaxID=1364935 RepID=UPI001091D53F|nr:radical SAM protein [Halorussus salinus]